jgi:hypothetical protein
LENQGGFGGQNQDLGAALAVAVQDGSAKLTKTGKKKKEKATETHPGRRGFVCTGHLFFSFKPIGHQKQCVSGSD